MLTSIRSRTRPALLTSASRRPNASTASRTSCSPYAQSETSPLLATASPPAARISSTTASAASPTSFTTTCAPSAANARACARPMPCPAPVTMTTRPSLVTPTIANLASAWAGGAGSVRRVMHMELTKEQAALQSELRAYFAKLLTPEVRTALGGEGDNPELFRELVRQMGADGWLGLGWPTEYGGGGATAYE